MTRKLETSKWETRSVSSDARLPFRLALLFSISIIFALGLVSIFDTTSAEILDQDLERNVASGVFKQLMYAAAGLALALGVRKWGAINFIRLSPKLLAIFSFLLVLCFAPVIGREVNGSHRWLSLGGFSFQPSEFVKFIIPAFFIWRISLLKDEEISLAYYLKTLAIVSIPIGLIVIEPNNGTAGVITLLIAAVSGVANVRFKYWGVPLLTILALSVVLATSLPYVQGRLKVYWNPELDLLGKGHQPYQAKIAAGSGGLLGKGPGNSLQKLSYLPEAQNDYIAAIFAEEYGFVGISFLIILYMILAYAGFSIAYFAKTPEECVLAAAITFLISFQAFMNLGVVSGLLPSTGLNLPFFSQGGTSLIANLMGVGLLFEIGKRQADA